MVALGFRSSGLLTEVTVEVGDEVEAGDVLARMDDTEARKAVTAAELQVTQAEATLASQQDPTAAQRLVTLAGFYKGGDFDGLRFEPGREG